MEIEVFDSFRFNLDKCLFLRALSRKAPYAPLSSLATAARCLCPTYMMICIPTDTIRRIVAMKRVTNMKGNDLKKNALKDIG